MLTVVATAALAAALLLGARGAPWTTLVVVSCCLGLVLAARTHGRRRALSVRHALRDARRALAEERELNERMNRFVQSVSHDLKAPLVTTNGFLAMARSTLDEGDAEAAVEFIERTEASTSRMDRMINDLLELSRAGAASPTEPVDLDREVAAVLDDVLWRFEDRGVRLNIGGPLGHVAADGVRVRQVVQNLLTNALKYGCDGPDPRVDVWSETSRGGLRLFVADHGAGIAREDRERIFDVFTRLPGDTRREGVEGTGVGLAIVKRAMDSLGGAVTLRTTVGGGATFALQFPASEATATAA